MHKSIANVRHLNSPTARRDAAGRVKGLELTRFLWTSKIDSKTCGLKPVASNKNLIKAKLLNKFDARAFQECSMLSVCGE